MIKTIHIPISDEDKETLKLASEKEKLKLAPFVRRVALLKADEILKQNQEVQTN